MPNSSDILNASLIYREDFNNELRVIRIRPDSGEVAPFKPGQFTTIGLPRDPSDEPPANAPQGPGKPRTRLLRRAFSIASSANERDHLELYVVLVDDGRFTPMLWDLNEGDKIWMDDKIKGGFTLDGVPPDKDLVLVATGTGLAPYLSMLRTHRGQDRWRRLVIIHGVRLADDLGYREELERASAEDETVVYLPTVTREPDDSDWQGLRGRVQAVLEPEAYEQAVGAKLDPQQCHVFLCGNPAMITSSEEMLKGHGFTLQTRDQPGNIHFERYW